MTDGHAETAGSQPQGLPRLYLVAWLVLVVITAIEVSLILVFRVPPAVLWFAVGAATLQAHATKSSRTEPVSILPHRADRHDHVPGGRDPRPREPIGWDAARYFSWAVRVEPVYAVPRLAGMHGLVFAARRPAWQLYP